MARPRTDDPRSSRIVVRVTEDERARYERLARHHRMTLSALFLWLFGTEYELVLGTRTKRHDGRKVSRRKRV
jgi:hypothetical protein